MSRVWNKIELVLAVGMLALLLVGCQGGNEQASPVPTATPTIPETAPTAVPTVASTSTPTVEPTSEVRIPVPQLILGGAEIGEAYQSAWPEIAEALEEEGINPDEVAVSVVGPVSSTITTTAAGPGGFYAVVASEEEQSSGDGKAPGHSQVAVIATPTPESSGDSAEYTVNVVSLSGLPEEVKESVVDGDVPIEYSSGKPTVRLENIVYEYDEEKGWQVAEIGLTQEQEQAIADMLDYFHNTDPGTIKVSYDSGDGFTYQVNPIEIDGQEYSLKSPGEISLEYPHPVDGTENTRLDIYKIFFVCDVVGGLNVDIWDETQGQKTSVVFFFARHGGDFLLPLLVGEFGDHTNRYRSPIGTLIPQNIVYNGGRSTDIELPVDSEVKVVSVSQFSDLTKILNAGLGERVYRTFFSSDIMSNTNDIVKNLVVNGMAPEDTLIPATQEGLEKFIRDVQNGWAIKEDEESGYPMMTPINEDSPVFASVRGYSK